MARSLQVFKDHLAETTRMRTEQEAMKLRAAEDRRAVLARIADEFERSIGGVIRAPVPPAVEELGAATKEIAQSVQRASQGTHDVMQTIVGVREASGQVDAAATRVLNAAGQLTIQSEQLKSETGKFLGNIRAA
jgi:methyl-accepting chemotaxis protein